MNRVQQLGVWLTRLGHCRGFGIQAPDDYRFVRYVINEHWPYYAYDQLAPADDWLQRKLGRLYLRLANYLQPQTVVDMTGHSPSHSLHRCSGMEAYLKAGCQRSTIVSSLPPSAADGPSIILCDGSTDASLLIDACSQQTMLVVHRMWECKELWQAIVADQRTFTTFDLFYCGIAFFRQRHDKHQYIVNF